MRLAVRRGGGRGMDGGEPVGHLRADHEGAIAAVRGPEDIDPVRVHVAEQDELADQPLDQRADRVVVEAVPLVVGRAEGQVDVAAGLGVLLVVTLEHALPLLVVDRLRGAAAAVHRDDQRPAVRPASRRRAARGRGSCGPSVVTVFASNSLPERLVGRRRLVGLPGERAQRLVAGNFGEELPGVRALRRRRRRSGRRGSARARPGSPPEPGGRGRCGRRCRP